MRRQPRTVKKRPPLPALPPGGFSGGGAPLQAKGTLPHGIAGRFRHVQKGIFFSLTIYFYIYKLYTILFFTFCHLDGTITIKKVNWRKGGKLHKKGKLSLCTLPKTAVCGPSFYRKSKHIVKGNNP